jgi:hypothetical protein
MKSEIYKQEGYAFMGAAFEVKRFVCLSTNQTRQCLIKGHYRGCILVVFPSYSSVYSEKIDVGMVSAFVS